MKSLRTAIILKSLKEQGLTNGDIIDLFKMDGLDGLATLAGMGEVG
ncbi:hypothetical protein LCGC14_2477240 [marine sediment metagenome]|uniref:Uncharacterized protein n=1 Tax=marine sediment metagenome TaxID=412755 RepID=A0A0F9B9E1_9ZZZZ